jgi:hypothetical protein
MELHLLALIGSLLCLESHDFSVLFEKGATPSISFVPQMLKKATEKLIYFAKELPGRKLLCHSFALA